MMLVLVALRALAHPASAQLLAAPPMPGMTVASVPAP